MGSTLAANLREKCIHALRPRILIRHFNFLGGLHRMHLGSLPGLLLALAWGLLGGSSAQHIATTGVSAGLNSPIVYSIVAQAETTPTVTLSVSATATLGATSTPEATPTATILPATPIPLPT